jgi:tetratricopeptide (TPR) repeat protein
MRTTSPKLDSPYLTANDRALLQCQTALELIDKGEYYRAREVMFPLWKRVGERPETKRLHPSVAAEVLLCVGMLTRWIGSKHQIKEAQDAARDIISESITFFESIGDVKKVAAARAELAYCYWREGELDEARIMFNEALQKLTVEGNTRANALLGLSVVEWAASRYSDALRILTENALLFKKITNHTIKGFYHNQRAMILRQFAISENRDDYFQQAIGEYQQADYHFKLAHNIVFRANVKNNVGNVLRQLSRFKEAHNCIAEARRLAVSIRDKVLVAQFDDTRAQVFIAEGRLAEAESAARSAVRVLEKSGHQCLLADSLITHGIALARLQKTELAQFTLQRAIDVANQVGVLNKAGLAALTMIEEIDQLSPVALYAAYDRASEWLAESKSQDMLRRVNAAGRKVFSSVHGLKPEEATEILLSTARDIRQEALKSERTLIRQALAKENGSVTRAARLVGMSYQGLAYAIEARHPDLLKERSPVHRRSRKES